jgi:hypothetical protein
MRDFEEMVPTKSAEFESFCEWYATPPKLREPKTMGKKCKELGININTTAQWRQTKIWDKTIRKYVRKWGRGILPTIMGSLQKGIIKHADASRIELWLEYFEDYIPKQQILGDTEDETQLDLDDFTVEELRQMKEIQENARKRKSNK